MRIRFTLRARADLESILRHVGEENPEAAAKLVESIETLIETLGRHPKLGRPTQPPGRRVLTAPRAPYRVFYPLGVDEIRILHVRHTSRCPLRS